MNTSQRTPSQQGDSRHRRRRGRPAPPPDLKIVWANARKSPGPHNALLNLCWADKVDVIHVQEPWTGEGTRQQNNPGYNAYAPVDAWDALEERPRVLTYIRKGGNLRVQQRRPVHSRDMLWIDVNGYSMLNVYREPRTNEVMDYVTNLTPPARCLIGGDWNARDPTFEPGSESRDRGADLARWAINSGMPFSGIPGLPTHRAGHVLDMVFTNVPFAETTLADHFEFGSDHYALLTVVPVRGTGAPEQFRTVVHPDNKDKFCGLIQCGMATAPDPTTASTPAEIEHCSAVITQVFSTAIEGAGTKVADRGRSAEWWNDECKEAYKEYRTAELQRPLGAQEYTEEHRRFLATVRRAKREYWRGILDLAITDNKLYKVIAWHKLGPKLKSPPLRVGDQVIEDELGKAKALKTEVLERFSEADDLDYDPLTEWQEDEQTLPWEDTATPEEVEKHTIGVSSTSPGVDWITVHLMRDCWEHIKEYIHALFNACLRHHYFPARWKSAEVAMIPKVGKKDRTSPRSWRPIALLSCLGKGLERLVAKRLAWTSLIHKVLSPQHGGALPKRSTMDLVASFTHEAEYALRQGKKISLVTLDVQGAFDALLRRRLLQRMRRQGWALSLLRFVDSFLSGRRIRVRLEGATTEYSPVRCGTPQGSPLSPVLYMLYLAELLNADPTLRFGYADDVAIYRASNSLHDNAAKLAEDVREIFRWGDANKVVFAPEKIELIHITRSRDDDNPPVEVSSELTIQPTGAAARPGQTPAVRWLGVWFDRNLRFRRHVDERSNRAMALARHIRSLANTKNGPPADMLRKAVITCVIPTALYGNEAWYGGRQKPARNASQAKKEMVSAKVGYHVDKIHKAMKLAARSVLPVWKTTPTDTVFRDAGLPTAQAALDEALYRFAYRLRTVDKTHPLARRVNTKRIIRGRNAGQHELPKTKVQTTARLLQPVQRPELRMPRYTAGSRTDPTEGQSKTQAAKAFKRWFRDRPADEVVVFTDGSQKGDDVGYGFAVYLGQECIGTGQGKLETPSINFDGEAVGAWKGLEHVIRERPDLGGRRIWVCLDNTGVIWCLRADAPASAQWAYLRFQEAMETYNVRVKWCPGHCGVEGNEKADELAKAGSELSEADLNCTRTAYGVRAQGKKLTKATREEWWRKTKARLSDRYRFFRLDYEVRCHEELAMLTREELHRYLAVRHGHGDFAWYHRRFRHELAKLECSCGRAKAPEHLVHCRKAPHAKWPRKNGLAPDGPGRRAYLRIMMEDPKHFRDFCDVTKFYSDICTR
jgi:ribonuclease HI